VALGLYRNRSVERIKGNQATFDNSQRNNLRSCVWVRLVVFLGEGVLPLRRRETSPFLSEKTRVRGSDSGLDSPEVQGPHG